MSAWKPTVSGSPTRSSRSTIVRQECMPPQQISPSAASRSPWSRAIVAACLKVSAIFFWLPAGSLAQSAGRAGRVDPDDAVRPDAQLAELLAIRQRLADRGRGNSAAAASSPIAEASNQTGATTEPITKPLAGDLVGHGLEVLVADVDVDVGVVEEEVDAVELDAVDLGRGGQVEHRLAGRWSARRPGSPCRPRRATSRCAAWGTCWDGWCSSMAPWW